MDASTLRIILPAFIFVFLGTISVWAYVRKKKHIALTPPMSKAIQPEVKLVDLFYKCLLTMVTSVIFLYSLAPELYQALLPIEWLDNDFMNWMGVFTLATSLVWIVVAQFNIEKIIALVNAGAENVSFQKLVTSSQKLLMTGFLIMFIGFFLTLSSAVSLLIMIIAVAMLQRLQRSAIAQAERAAN